VGRSLGLDDVVDHFTLVGDELDLGAWVTAKA